MKGRQQTRPEGRKAKMVEIYSIRYCKVESAEDIDGRTGTGSTAHAGLY